MKLPDKVYKTLVDVCNAYPWDVVQDDFHIGEILNAVAWAHRADGWGLSYKASGKHIDSPVGPIAEDILQLPTGDHFDVLGGIDVGQPLRPGQASSIGIINLKARPWVKPVDHPISWLIHKPEEPKEPTKPEEPKVPEVTQCNCNIQPAVDEVKGLSDAVHSLIDQVRKDIEQLRLDVQANTEAVNKIPEFKCRLRF
jgi:hypothetical protein